MAQLQQLECTEDVLGAQVHMVDAAEQGDRLAMAALGSMFLLGQDCARKRNLTWGYHWLSRAVELEQPDALALMGFLHTTDVLRDLYNFTAVTHDRAAGIRMMQRGAAGGSPFANLAMGFRYMAGAGVAESCPTSGVYYEAAALSARHAAPGSNNVRARAFVRAQPKKSVATFSVCADDAFAARVAAAKAAVGGPPPAPMQGLPPKFKAGTSMPPKASMPPPPAPKAEAPANEFSWDSAPSAARQSAPSAAPAARRQAVDLDNVDPDFAPRTNSGYSAPAASYNPTPTSNVVS